jgi:hypothetical protein
MSSKIIRLIDRTRTVADWKCSRARYWGYEHNGRGVVKGSMSLALDEGILVHDALATIAHLTLNELPIDIDEIAETAQKDLYSRLVEAAGPIVMPDAIEYAQEQSILIEGLIRGFYKFMWPKLMLMYPEIVCVEQEMEYPLDQCPSCGGAGTVRSENDEAIECSMCKGAGVNFVFMTKPDLIMESPEGELVYIEYKTTSSKKAEWVNSWETAVQLHSSVKATEYSLGKLPSAVQILGLYKGYTSYGKQSSPFCYAYKKSGNPPFTQDQVAYEYKAGFKRYPTWELDGGLKKWVDEMPDEVLANQFPLTPQIYVNEDLVASFFKQRLSRERTIKYGINMLEKAQTNEAREAIMDDIFPQKFDSCSPSYGWGCQYRKLCFGRANDPLEEGFIERLPHHELELEQLGLNEDGTLKDNS